jgi:hypothetical protein
MEKEVFGGILVYPDFAAEAHKKLELQDFENTEIRQALQSFFADKKAQLERHSSVAKEAVFMVESLIENTENNTEAVERQLFKSLAMLKVATIKQQLMRLQQELKFAESANNKEQISKIQSQILDLTHLRMEFESKF